MPHDSPVPSAVPAIMALSPPMSPHYGVDVQGGLAELGDIPTDYLEAYPFPAFVLPMRSSPSETSKSQHAMKLGSMRGGPSAPSSLDPVWHNAHWRRVSGERSLLDCASSDTAKRISCWLSGAASRDGSPQTAGASESVNGGRPILRHQTWNGTPAAGVHSLNDDDLDGGSATLTAEFTFGKGTAWLQLLCTSVPVRQPRDRLLGATSLAVITTIPQTNMGLFRPLRSCTPRKADTKPFDHTTRSVVDNAEELDTAAPTDPTLTTTRDAQDTDALANPELVAHGTLFNGHTVVQNWNPGNGIRVLIDGTAIEEYSGTLFGTGAAEVRENLFSKDWAATPLGPMSQWPDKLRTLVGLAMGCGIPQCIWWGPELTMVYNNSYAKMCENHPDMYGTSGPEAWAELRRTLGPHLETLLAGKSLYRDDQLYLYDDKKTGKVVETYRSYVFATAVDDQLHFSCIWTGMRDSTGKVILDRRSNVMKELSDRTLTARQLHDFEKGVLETLHSNPKEAPFGLLYHVDKAQVLSASSASTVRLRYAGGVGVPISHPSAPEIVNVDLAQDQGGTVSSYRMQTAALGSLTPALASSRPGTPAAGADSRVPWPFAQALRTNAPVFVADCSEIIRGYTARVWDELPSTAVVIPLGCGTSSELPGAVLVLGISCRLAYDAAYEGFIRDLRNQIAVNLSMVQLYMADQQRIEHLADIDRDKSNLLLGIAHQLASPLSLVLGPLDDLIDDLDGETDSETMTRLCAVRTNVRRLKRLVEMLNDVSHMQMDRLKGAFKQENLGQVTRGICALFTEAAVKWKCRYEYHCDETPHQTYVSRELWEKILFVLIGGGMQLCKRKIIELVLKYTATHAVLHIGDNGDLFLPGNRPNVTERYSNRMVDVSALPKDSSVALGFVLKMVEMHRGTFRILNLTSDVEPVYHGTLFEVMIPFGTAHLAPDLLCDVVVSGESTEPTAAGLDFSHEILDEMNQNWNKRSAPAGRDTREGASVASSESLTSRSSKRVDLSTLYFKKTDIIMIVDDVPANRAYIRSIFEPFCSIIEAHEGQDALTKFTYLQPDLIIADVMISRVAGRRWDDQRNLNGVELLRELRQGTKEQQMVPVIMLTGVDEPDLGSLRADDTIVRPFKSKELIARAHMQMQLGKRRRMLEQLFEERTMELRVLTENSPVAIFLCDSTGAMTYGNAAWYEISGTPVEDGKDDPDMVLDWKPYIMERYVNMFEDLDQWTETGGRGVETECQWKNGRWCSVRMLRLDTIASGLKPGFFGCMVDITERKLNEDLQWQRVIEAEQRRAEAEEAKRQQELLIDITSHEIRNPISSLMQCASLVKTNLLCLRDQLSDVIARSIEFIPTRQLLMTLDEDLEALDSIYQCGLAQERISNDVLSLSKIQLDLLEVFDVETDVGKEARKAVAIFQNEARMNRIQLQLVISDTFSKVGLETVMTDPVRVGQVVTNLLSNATKFTASSVERRIELRIDIGFERPPNGSCTKPPAASEDVQVQEGMPVYIYVSVSDTGPGLTEAELEHLFERFTQASPMTHTVFGGSGLGLFVCRKIVLRMGGGIDVTSEYGKGSEFRFFIEAKVGTVAPPVAVKPTSSPTPGLGKPSTPNRKTPRGVAGMKAKGFSKSADQSNTLPSTKRRILVVEDNLINRTVLLRQLKHVGWVADSATNGLEGVKKIRTAMNLDVDREGDEPGAGAVDGAGYDCVLMDLEMPVMDGYTAVRNVREHESLGELRRSTIIALTGNARQAQLDDHMANFDEVVVKPYRLDDLLHKIEQVIRQVEQVPKNNGSGGGRVIPIGTNGRVGSPRPGTALSKSCGP